MGWKDAPLVEEAEPVLGWRSAPIVEPAPIPAAQGPPTAAPQVPQQPVQTPLIPQVPSAPTPISEFGTRTDGTPKGQGFLGALPRTDIAGQVSSELSIGVNLDGKETEIPTMVPTLTGTETNWLLADNDVLGKSRTAKSIRRKAIEHAKRRMLEGRSPFADAQDPTPPPPFVKTLPPEQIRRESIEVAEAQLPAALPQRLDPRFNPELFTKLPFNERQKILSVIGIRGVDKSRFELATDYVRALGRAFTGGTKKFVAETARDIAELAAAPTEQDLEIQRRRQAARPAAVKGLEVRIGEAAIARMRGLAQAFKLGDEVSEEALVTNDLDALVIRLSSEMDELVKDLTPFGEPPPPLTLGDVRPSRTAKDLRLFADAMQDILRRHPEWESEQEETAIGLLSNPKALAGQLGALLPYMAATTAAFLATGPAGAAVVAYAVEASSAYRGALASGATEPEAQMTATIVGAGNALIEMVQIGQIVKFAKKSGASIVARDLSRRARAKMLAGMTARQAFNEGLEEALQGANEDITGKIIFGKDLSGFWNRRSVEAVIGGIAGVFLGGAGATARAITQSYANRSAEFKLQQAEFDALQETGREAELAGTRALTGALAEIDVGQQIAAAEALPTEGEARQAAQQAEIDAAQRESVLARQERAAEARPRITAADTEAINAIVEESGEFADKAGITGPDGLVTVGFRDRNAELLQAAAEAVESGDVEATRKAFAALKPKMVEWGQVKAGQRAKDLRAKAKKAQGEGRAEEAVADELDALEAEAQVEELAEKPAKAVEKVAPAAPARAPAPIAAKRPQEPQKLVKAAKPVTAGKAFTPEGAPSIPAMKLPDGTIISDSEATSHLDLLRRKNLSMSDISDMQQEANKGIESGWVGPNGEFVSEAELMGMTTTEAREAKEKRPTAPPKPEIAAEKAVKPAKKPEAVPEITEKPPTKEITDVRPRDEAEITRRDDRREAERADVERARKAKAEDARAAERAEVTPAAKPAKAEEVREKGREEVKQPWEITEAEWRKLPPLYGDTEAWFAFHRAAQMGVGNFRAYRNAAARGAVLQGEPVPAAVLQDYADEPWAKEALAKLEEIPRAEAIPSPETEVQREPSREDLRRRRKDEGREKPTREEVEAQIVPAAKPEPVAEKVAEAPKPKFADNKVFTQESVDAARERIRQRTTGERPTAGLDPQMISDWAVVGLGHAEAIIRKVGKLTRQAWNKAMRAEGPSLTSKDLTRIWVLVRKDSAKLAGIAREVRKPVVAAPPSKEVTAEVVAPPAEPGEEVGIKNAAIEEQLARRGQLPPRHGPSMTFEQARAEAATAFEVDPFVGKKLVDELFAAPRPATGYEDAVLVHEMTRLTHELDRAETAYLEVAQSDDVEVVAQAQRRLDEATADYALASDVVTMVGTESSRSLGYRRMMLKLDFSLAAMERRAQITQGGEPLADAERQLIVKQAKQIANLEQRIADVETEAQVLRRQHEIDTRIKVTVRRTRKAAALIQEPTFGIGNVVFKRPGAMKSKVALFALLRSPQMALGPGGMEHLVKLGGFYVEGGLRNFKQWKAQILDDAGDLASELEPDLAEAWKQITNQLPRIDRPRIIEAMKVAFESDRALPEMATSISKIAESLIEGGIHDREQLVTALHGILKDIDPSITRDQTMDALSGYGDYRPLNQDPIKAELRDYKGQLQQVAKLRGLQEMPPTLEKTGLERRVPTDEERRLIRQVNEAKRRSGYVATDPATQLKGSLQSMKTRMVHQIADIELEIATRTRISKIKTPVARDAEALILQERLKDLREQRDAIFGKKELTDEQRIAIAEKVLQKANTELEQRIADKQPFPKKRFRKMPVTPELTAMRARNDALKHEIKLMQDAADIADPTRKDAILNQAFATRTANRIADLQERLAKQDFDPRPKRKPLELSPASIKLQVQLVKVKEQYDLANFRRQLAQRTIPKKVLDAMAEGLNLPKQLIASGELSGILRQGGIISISHPLRAAKIVIPSMKALVSEEGFIAAEEAIKNHERYPYWLRAGLDMTSKTRGLAAMEEGHMSRLASKIPGIRASERHYMTWLNLQRYTACEHLALTLYPEGQTPSADEAKIIAHAVNIMTGRGGQGLGPGALGALSTIFWAPRLRISRFQYLLGHPIWYGAFSRKVSFKGTGRVRLLLAKEYLHFLSKLLVLYGVGLLLGGDAELDPRSPDFGKMRFGDTRVDPAAGLLQPVVFVSKIITGRQIATSGKNVSLLAAEKEFGGAGIASTLGRYVQSGLSPGLGQLIAIRYGETFVGEKVTPLTTARDMTIPLAWRDAYEAIESEGYSKGTALTALAFLGMGLSTYVSARPKTREIRKLAYDAEVAHAEEQNDETRAEQMHYDTIERTLKTYDTAANKLRETGEQNTPKGRAIRTRQEQLSAIALDGGMIWDRATPTSREEVKLAFKEYYHSMAEAAISGEDFETEDREERLAALAIQYGLVPRDTGTTAKGGVKTSYTNRMFLALEAGDIDAAAAYFKGRFALGVTAPDMAKGVESGIKKRMLTDPKADAIRKALIAAAKKALEE